MRLTSHMAGVADPFMRWLAEELDLAWVDGPWPDRLSLLASGEVELGWVCGLLHACRRESLDWPWEAIAAPVMISDRHGGLPHYFGDVVVSSRSEARSCDDLAGTVFAYNEKSSLSGYQMLLHRLGSLDRVASAVQSGAHADSLNMVRTGLADVAVIDSTVMDMMAGLASEDFAAVRVLESIGPYPMPPIVASRSTSPQWRAEIRHQLLSLHLDERARTSLATWGVARFESVSDEVYLGLVSGCQEVF